MTASPLRAPRRGRPPRRGRAALTGVLSAALLLAACSNGDGDDNASSTTLANDDLEVIGAGSNYEATIRRGTGGVPHITAASLADAAFGQGYASAEDRTCDLADQIVRIRGERAKWLGAGDEDANLNSDIAWRTIGIFDRASDDWDAADADTRKVLTAFTDGWNLHLDHVGADEIRGWCAGAAWLRPIEPVEVYAYARSIALTASSGAVARFIADAQPPGTEQTPAGDESAAPASLEAGQRFETGLRSEDASLASNGWAIGSEMTTDGTSMLLANPHFPWEGELRFWESHLTIAGEADIYGVQLSGLPGIGIGFNEHFGWTHTVSDGNRFTAYTLDLVDGSPTTYRYGDDTREMTPIELSIEVLGDDGNTTTVEHTSWASHYGPIIEIPGLAWSDTSAVTFRDANIDNTAFLDQYLAFTMANDLDEFRKLNEQYNATPLFNTIAASDDGTVWYADTSATPNLSDEAIAAYESKLSTDAITAIAAESGVILLDGSDPGNEWVEVDGARSPGLVPFDRQPQLERSDYVFNANDSFWTTNAKALLDGDYSILHGRQGTLRSPRTRENLTLITDATGEGPSGDDATFTLDELADAATWNTGYTSRALIDSVLERCTGVAEVEAACNTLAAWDRRYNVDSAGAALWRELVSQFDLEATAADDSLADGSTPLWAEAFDPSRPFDTPAGLAPAPADAPDPVITKLTEAVRRLELAGFAADSTLGDVQFALRNGERVGVPGGSWVDGAIAIGSSAQSWTITDPALKSFAEREDVADDSTLTTGDDQNGYLVNYGNSFVLAVEFTKDGPAAKAFLTYSNTEDRTDPNYLEATTRYAAKDWRDVEFREESVAAATTATYRVRG